MTAAETDLWVQTVNQIVMASQRAILAALDMNLLLAQRTLQAEHSKDLSNGVGISHVSRNRTA